MAFLVNFSRGGSAIAGDTPAATGAVVVVVSLIRWIGPQASCLCGRLGSTLPKTDTRVEACLLHRLEVYVPLPISLGDRLGLGHIDIFLAVPGHRPIR